MIRIIWILLAGLLLGMAAWWGVGNESYVLIRVGDWAIQLSVWAVLFSLLVLWFVVALLRVLLSGFGFFDWRRRHQEKSHRRQLRKSFLAYFEADWKSAGKTLLKIADRTEDPLPYLLLAAVATARQGDMPKAMQIIDNLESAFPAGRKAAGLLRARICADYQQVDTGLKEVEKLRKEGVNSAELNLLEAQLAHLGGDMERMSQAIKSLQSQKLSRAELINLQRYYYLFQLARTDLASAELTRLLRSIPPMVLNDSAVIAQVVLRLRDVSGDEAVELLTGWIEKTWRPELIVAYGEIESSQVRKQLKRAERWHTGHLSVELLDTLHKLSWKANDSDRAHDYAQQLRVLRRSRND
jgi:HemY protein